MQSQGVELIHTKDISTKTSLAPGWVAETIAIWTQFPARKGILDLTNRGIESVPTEIYRMRKLKELILDKNEITVIPGELGTLAEAEQLEIIKASQNKIQVVEDGLGPVHTMKKLILDENLLEEFPAVATKFMSLTDLVLAKNSIPSIPPSISGCMDLKHLDISYNKLVEIPESIGLLPNLEHLDLAFNELTTLPGGIGKIKNLKVLRVNNNKLKCLPMEFGLLVQLDELNVENNPFDDAERLQSLDPKMIVQKLREEIRLNQETRKWLFKEKDNDKNVRFEIKEEVDSKPVMVAATPEKLTMFLTQVQLPDTPTLKAVLLCYTYFMKPHVLLELMNLRLLMNVSDSGEAESVAKIVRLRVFSATLKLMIQFNKDNVVFPPETKNILTSMVKILADHNMIAAASQLKKTASMNESISELDVTIPDAEETEESAKEEDPKAAKARKKEEEKRKKDQEKDNKKSEKEKKKLEKEAEKKRKKEEKATKKKPGKGSRIEIPPPPSPLDLPPPVFGLENHDLALKSSSGSSNSDISSLTSFKPKDIATQFAKMNSELFKKITASELIHQRWAKDGKEKTAANILAVIDHFNRLSGLLSTLIVNQKELKKRMELLHFILDIAQESMIYGDFSSLYSIASALNASAISRLRHTWNLVDSKHIQINTAITQLTNNSGNYKEYRSLLTSREAGSRVIPYLGLTLSDLTFTEEGNPDYIAGTDLINVGKYRILLKVIEDIEKYQAMDYSDLEEKSTIRLLIECSEILGEEALYQESLKCEASRRTTAAVHASDLKTTQSVPSVVETGEKTGRRMSMPGPIAPLDGAPPPTGISSSMSVQSIAEVANSAPELPSSHSVQNHLHKAALSPRFRSLSMYLEKDN